MPKKEQGIPTKYLRKASIISF